MLQEPLLPHLQYFYAAGFGSLQQCILKEATFGMVHSDVGRLDFVNAPVLNWLADKDRTADRTMARRIEPSERILISRIEALSAAIIPR